MNIRVGFHVSIAGGISNSVDNASKIGCGAFQIFSRNPRGWAAKPLGDEDVKNFRAKLAKSSISPESVIVHMPYLPNLAAPDGELYKKSVDTLAAEIHRCGTLGIPYLVIHLGSHLGKGTESGISQLVKGCNYAVEHSPDRQKKNNVSVRILLENMAGQKNSLGSKFEEIRLILDKLKGDGLFGVCLDTCHAFVAGYDLRKEEDVEKILDHFYSTVGLKELKALHLNDSKGDLNCKVDRHEHIGLGKIGNTGFAALLNHKLLVGLPMIMETPVDDNRADIDNLKIVLQLANKTRS
ncbi:MAG: deoxyribonuclease IV [Candidatus Nitrosopolaris sp.]